MPGRINLRTSMAVASAVGRLAHRLGARPRPAEVQRLLEGMPHEGAVHAGRIARAACIFSYRNRALAAVIRRGGLEAPDALLDPEGLDELEALATRPGPAVLVTWHGGPPGALAAALARVGIEALGLVRGIELHRDARENIALTGGGEDARSAALWRSVKYLKGGGLVVVAVDGRQGTRSAEVECLGRAVRLARGPFALARLSGAPLIPVAPRWTTSGLIRVDVADPVDTRGVGPGDGEAFEAACAAATARWLAQRFLARPEQMGRRTLQWLLAAPPVHRRTFGQLREDTQR